LSEKETKREREKEKERKSASHIATYAATHAASHAATHAATHYKAFQPHVTCLQPVWKCVLNCKYKRNLLNNPMKTPKDLYSANSQSPDSPSMCFLFYQKRPIFYPKSPFHKKSSILYGNKNKQHTSSQNAWK